MCRSRSSLLTTVLSLLLLCLVLPLSSAWSVDAFHPDANRERRHVEEDARAKERSNEDALAKSRETWRKEDLTNRPKQEFSDLSKLEAKIEAQKNAHSNVEMVSRELMTRRYEKGNFGIGTGTSADANRVGRDWVGADAKLAGDGKTLVSSDKLRQYRPPALKKDGRVQANYERRDHPNGSWIGNAHLDIKEK